MGEDKISTTMYLDHIHLKSKAADNLVSFYRDIVDMDVKQIDDGNWLCSAPSRRVLIGSATSSGLGFVAYACESEGSLETLRNRIVKHGYVIEESPSPLFTAPAFSVKDPDGTIMVFGVAKKTTVEKNTNGRMQGRLQHLAMDCPDVKPLIAFYRDVIGLQISDTVEDDDKNARGYWLRGDVEHHCFAMFLAPDKGLDHYSYEVTDWSLIRDWADRVTKKNVELFWGPGRHGPGNNLFIMFCDTDGNKIEISTELEQIETDKPIGVWPYTEHTLNMWGKSWLRS